MKKKYSINKAIVTCCVVIGLSQALFAGSPTMRSPFGKTPYVREESRSPYAYSETIKPETEKTSEIAHVMSVRNALLKKAGYDTESSNLTASEQDYLKRALKLYPVYQI